MLDRRTAARLGAGSATALLVTAIAATPASAHVTITPTGGTAAGSSTVLTFSVGHGCEGSPTTALDISVPEEILSVTPTLLPGWQVDKTMVALEEPVEDSHGSSVTERVGQVTYTADRPLPDGFRAAMELSLQLPDAPGQTLTFPVIQKCAQGETAWTETPAEGEDAEELESPAPTVTITEATDEADETGDEAGDEAGNEAGDEAGDGTAGTASATPTTRTVEVKGDSDAALGLAALAAGLLAIVMALMALTRSRRAP